jgi:hypothetical protein
MEKTSNHNESGSDQTDVKNGILKTSFLNVTEETKPINFCSKDENKVHYSKFEIDEAIEACPIKSEYAKEWYSKYDTAWYFSTTNDNKLVKIPEKKPNKIPESQQNDDEIKNSPNLNEPSKKEKRSKQSYEFQENKSFFRKFHYSYLFFSRKLYEIRWKRLFSSNKSEHDNEEEFQSKDDIALGVGDLVSDSFDDLFISQNDYEISVRTKLTQYILLFILFLQSIIFLINNIYSLAIGILVINWITLFYFIIRSCFEIKKPIW